VVGYIALRLERSLGAARAFIDALDREAMARQRRISRAMAADVLRSMEGSEEQGFLPGESSGPAGSSGDRS
jgi:chromosomal replication initiation ATPase DnaA